MMGFFRYKQCVVQAVSSNLYQAELGGVPGTLQLIKSFLKIKIPSGTQNLEDGEVDGQPVWPLIYYCLRCGDLDAAMQVAAQAQWSSADLWCPLLLYWLSVCLMFPGTGWMSSEATYTSTFRQRIPAFLSQHWTEYELSTEDLCVQVEIHSRGRKTRRSAEFNGVCVILHCGNTALWVCYRAVYSVIGCCDTSDNHSEVAVKTDDYMWLKVDW